ncbi:MAG: hypothetical protein ACYS5V_13480, partial [Planctomycetota bacterium]
MKLMMLLAAAFGAHLLLAGCTNAPGDGAAALRIVTTAPAASTGLRKMVLADYFPYHRTREHDGIMGSWRQAREAKDSKASKTFFNYNPDLVGPDG